MKTNKFLYKIEVDIENTNYLKKKLFSNKTCS